uniref:Apolipoprotein L2 n=1 Tax=Suricata suricatta TaxID=37032 RepID=A0A673VF80_SURSU
AQPREVGDSRGERREGRGSEAGPEDSESWDKLDLLLTDQKAWESFIAEANLTREEAEVLRNFLRALQEDLYMEYINRLQSDPLERKRFLNEFPQLKRELKGQIREFRKLVDKADKVHRNCAITNIVASSTHAVSSFLTMLGLGLAPVTEGVSLALCAAGIGLRAASTVTKVFSRLVERSKMSCLKAKARHLTSAGSDNGEAVAAGLCKNIRQPNSLKHWAKVLLNIGKNARTIRLSRSQFLLTSGNDHRMPGHAVHGCGHLGHLLYDGCGQPCEKIKHLLKGAKAESAEELRQWAKLLKSKLNLLIQTHEHLKKT